MIKHTDKHNWTVIQGNDFGAHSIHGRNHVATLKLWLTNINLKLPLLDYFTIYHYVA